MRKYSKRNRKRRKFPCKVKYEGYEPKYFLPDNLNLEELLIEHPPDFQDKYMIDKFKFIIDYIIRKNPDKKGEYEWYYKGYTPVSSQDLKAAFEDYAKYRQHLIKIGVIESDNFAIIGSKCFWNRLSRKYSNVFISTCKIKSPFLIKHSRNTEINELISSIIPNDLDHLTKWLNEGIQFDKKTAYEILYERKRKVNSNDLSIKTLKEIRKINYHQILIDNFDPSKFYPKIDISGWRLHHPLTNLPKIYRPLITYDGKKLIALDIANSQLILMNGLFNPDFFNTNTTDFPLFRIGQFNDNYSILDKIANKQVANKRIKDKFNDSIFLFPPKLLKAIQKEFDYSINFDYSHFDELYSTSFNSISILNNPSYSNLFNSHYTIYWQESSISQYPQDIQTFINLTCEGRFYNEFSELIYEKTGEKITEKDDLKNIFFTVAYTSNRDQFHLKQKKIFESVYPTVSKISKVLKRGDHSRFSILMQRIESVLILRHCAREFAESFPEIPLFSVHDSLIVPEGFEDIASSIIQINTLKLTGFRPTVRKENWFIE